MAKKHPAVEASERVHWQRRASVEQVRKALEETAAAGGRVSIGQAMAEAAKAGARKDGE